MGTLELSGGLPPVFAELLPMEAVPSTRTMAREGHERNLPAPHAATYHSMNPK